MTENTPPTPPVKNLDVPLLDFPPNADLTSNVNLKAVDLLKELASNDAPKFQTYLSDWVDYAGSDGYYSSPSSSNTAADGMRFCYCESKNILFQFQYNTADWTSAMSYARSYIWCYYDFIDAESGEPNWRQRRKLSVPSFDMTVSSPMTKWRQYLLIRGNTLIQLNCSLDNENSSIQYFKVYYANIDDVLKTVLDDNASVAAAWTLHNTQIPVEAINPSTTVYSSARFVENEIGDVIISATNYKAVYVRIEESDETNGVSVNYFELGPFDDGISTITTLRSSTYSHVMFHHKQSDTYYAIFCDASTQGQSSNQYMVRKLYVCPLDNFSWNEIQTKMSDVNNWIHPYKTDANIISSPSCGSGRTGNIEDIMVVDTDEGNCLVAFVGWAVCRATTVEQILLQKDWDININAMMTLNNPTTFNAQRYLGKLNLVHKKRIISIQCFGYNGGQDIDWSVGSATREWLLISWSDDAGKSFKSKLLNNRRFWYQTGDDHEKHNYNDYVKGDFYVRVSFYMANQDTTINHYKVVRQMVAVDLRSEILNL